MKDVSKIVEKTVEIRLSISPDFGAVMAFRASPRSRKLNRGVYGRPDGKIAAHIEIPADVRFAYGKDKIVKTLGTTDADEANRRHAKLVAEYEAAFDLLRRGSLSQEFEAFAVRLHEEQTSHIAFTADVERGKPDSRRYGNAYTHRTMISRLNTHDPDELMATVGWAADWFFSERLNVKAIDLPADLRSSMPYRQILRECAEVLKDSWRAGRQIDEGQTVTAPAYPALTAKPTESPDGNRAKDERAKLPVSRYHEEVYLVAKAEEVASKTTSVKRQSIKLFNDLVGDPPVFMVTQAQVADFRDKLKFLPDGRSAIPTALKEKTARELVALQASGAIKLKRTAAATINKHMRNVMTMLTFAQKQGHITMNPAHGMDRVKPSTDNPERQKRPFTRRELEAIFALPMFSGCEADTDRGIFKPGNVRIRDERFWIPVLLFLTGARAAEIAGLEKTEVKIEGAVARIVFKYTALRRLKNKESERVIPLHPWALKMGFADYVASLPAKTPFLFPKAVRSGIDPKTGQIEDDALAKTGAFRQFNRTLLKHVGLADDPEVSLHSFRHVFEDAMTGRDIPEEVMFRLTGRSVGGSRQIYAKSLQSDEEWRDNRAADYMKHVEKIDFGGLNIAKLFN